MFDRHIAFQARQQPRASAIVTMRGDISFAEFEDAIAAVATWTAGLKFTPERPVVVCLGDRYLHWLVLLALARVGVASASVAETASSADVARFAPQALITDRSDTGAPNCRRVEFSPSIASALIASGQRQRFSARPEGSGLARVASSSGTTGVPKPIGFSWDQIEFRFPTFMRASPASPTVCWRW